MGNIDDETALFAEYKDGADWLCIVVHRGDPVKCAGISIKMPTAASKWSVPAALVAAAYDGATAFAALITSHSAPGEGPWPSTSGSTWWSALDASGKAAVRDYVLWFAGRRPPI